MFQAVFSPQVLPKVVLSGPVLELIAALVNIAAVKGFDANNKLVDASLVAVEVVVGAEPLSRLGAVFNRAFKRLVVPGPVFAENSESARGVGG